jgi:membrane protein implicated in regulation of membrane protease activity
MRLEKILLIAIIVLLIASAITPFIIFYVVKDRAVAAQIGDTFGGTTAPLINISAILAVITTYLYQRRNDQRNSNKEQMLESFQNLKEELQKLDYVITTNNKDTGREIKHHMGADAIHTMIRALNNRQYTIETITELVPYRAVVNIYQYLSLLLTDLNRDKMLTPHDKQMLLTQFSLFYRNNLLIDKEQRGDEMCRHHGIKHIIPKEIYEQIVEIETKIR